MQRGFVYRLDGQARQGHRLLAAQKRGHLSRDAAHIARRLGKEHYFRQKFSEHISGNDLGNDPDTRASRLPQEFEPSDRLAQRTIFEDAPDSIEFGFEPLEGKFLPDDFKPGERAPGRGWCCRPRRSQ